jgi:hypothetical protein
LFPKSSDLNIWFFVPHPLSTMKLFVVVFGAALAASMVAAGDDTPDNANVVIYPEEQYSCSGCEDAITLQSCSPGVYDTCSDQAADYATLHGVVIKHFGCCGFGSGYGSELQMCIDVNDDCGGGDILKNSAENCNRCVIVIECDEVEPEPCCAPCCEEPTGLLWNAVKNVLGGGSSDWRKIRREWFKDSTDNDHHIHFHGVKSCGTYNISMNVRDIVEGEEREFNREFTCYKACCDCCFDLQLTAMQSTVIKRDNADECGNTMADTLLYPQNVNRVSNANGAVCFATYQSKNIVVVLADFYRLAAWYYEGNFAYTYEGGATSQLLFTYMCNQKATVAHAISNRWTDSAPAPATAPTYDP